MLMRTDPFRDFDRLIQQVAGTPARPAVMPMDAYRNQDTFLVQFDLPGVETDEIDLTVEKNVLTVHAERARPQEPRQGGDAPEGAKRPERRALPRHDAKRLSRVEGPRLLRRVGAAHLIVPGVPVAEFPLDTAQGGGVLLDGKQHRTSHVGTLVRRDRVRRRLFSGSILSRERATSRTLARPWNRARPRCAPG